MREQTRTNQSWGGRTLKMTPIRPGDCTKRTTNMIARRAFQISQARGFTPGHEKEDWKRAESEIVSPICYGCTAAKDGILVTATASHYKEGAIEICAEPHRLAIFGKQRPSSGRNIPVDDRYDSQEQEIVSILVLPVEIDPSGATARFDHCMMEISLPNARTACSVPLAHVPLDQRLERHNPSGRAT
jgi:HSP20 family molecular chaperone IbpA